MKKNVLIPAPSSARGAGGLVYSTDAGRMCPDCRQPVAACVCSQAATLPRVGPVRVTRQTKGRGGKTVTVVSGLPLDAVALAQCAKQLKAACGSGGTVKDGTIEVQGDHADLLVSVLQKQGHAAKRAG